ncbi:MAG TPA: hypothetical protein VJH90_04035 [archaeon]|nr:hypothetical protein [archaeon]
MSLPIGEATVVVSIALALAWGFIKFVQRRSHPDPEDVVDMIGLILIGGDMVAGVVLIAIALDLVPVLVLQDFKLVIGLGGGLLIGAGLYFYYLALRQP